MSHLISIKGSFFTAVTGGNSKNFKSPEPGIGDKDQIYFF
jgi:hypothetical protein